MNMTLKNLVLTALLVAECLGANNASSTLFQSLVVARGEQLMLTNGVFNVATNVAPVEWNFPSLIMVGNSSYRIKSDKEWGTYEVYLPNEDLMVVKGNVTVQPTVRQARVYGLGWLTLGAKSFEDTVSRVSVQVLDASSNMLYVTCMNSDRILLTFKNINVFLSGPSNTVDFAQSILRGGLVEGK